MTSHTTVGTADGAVSLDVSPSDGARHSDDSTMGYQSPGRRSPFAAASRALLQWSGTRTRAVESPIDSLVTRTSRRVVIAAFAYRAASAPIWVVGYAAGDQPRRDIVTRPWLLIVVTVVLVAMNSALCLGVIRRRLDRVLDTGTFFGLDILVVVLLNLWASTQVDQGTLMSQYADVFWLSTIGGAAMWTGLRGFRVGLSLIAGGLGLILGMARLNGIPFDVVNWGSIGMRVAWLIVGVGFALSVRFLVGESGRAVGRQAREAGREEERAAMLRAMHDTVLQTLEAMVARSQRDEVSAIDRLRELQGAARAQAVELRARLRRAEEEPGEIYDRLAELIATFEGQTGIATEFVYLGEAPTLSHDRTAAVVGAVGEALRNIDHHADARRVVVLFEALPDRARVTVRDDGRGFHPPSVRSEAFGIRGSIVGRLKDVRGGASIESALGHGTRVELWVPLSQ